MRGFVRTIRPCWFTGRISAFFGGHKHLIFQRSGFQTFHRTHVRSHRHKHISFRGVLQQWVIFGGLTHIKKINERPRMKGPRMKGPRKERTKNFKNKKQQTKVKHIELARASLFLFSPSLLLRSSSFLLFDAVVPPLTSIYTGSKIGVHGQRVFALSLGYAMNFRISFHTMIVFVVFFFLIFVAVGP